MILSIIWHMLLYDYWRKWNLLCHRFSSHNSVHWNSKGFTLELPSLEIFIYYNLLILLLKLVAPTDRHCKLSSLDRNQKQLYPEAWVLMQCFISNKRTGYHKILFLFTFLFWFLYVSSNITVDQIISFLKKSFNLTRCWVLFLDEN